MKKNRIIAIVLAAALVCSLAGVSALAAGKQKNDTSSTPAAQTDSTDTVGSSTTGETVYVIATAAPKRSSSARSMTRMIPMPRRRRALP